MTLDSEDCLRQLMAVRGALGASLVEYTSGMTVRAAGAAPGGDPHLTAAGVTGLVHASLGTAALASVGQAGRVEDIVLTAANGYHLVHFVAGGLDGRAVLYLWLDRELGNLAMTQRQLSSVARDLVAAPAP
jgi:hypothetical protein